MSIIMAVAAATAAASGAAAGGGGGTFRRELRRANVADLSFTELATEFETLNIDIKQTVQTYQTQYARRAEVALALQRRANPPDLGGGQRVLPAPEAGQPRHAGAGLAIAGGEAREGGGEEGRGEEGRGEEAPVLDQIDDLSSLDLDYEMSAAGSPAF